jgi:Xaa-Pro aminopeptidase/Xaa-Pro dipeptidase
LTPYAQRRKKLLSLTEGKQVVALNASNMFYLTDFFGGGVAVVHPDRTVVVTYPLEADRANEACKEAEIVVEKNWRKEALKTIEKHLGKGKVVVDEAGPPLKSNRFEEKTDLFLQARRAKDEQEIQRIRKACEGTDKVYEALQHELKPGRTEWQIAAEVMKVALEQRMIPSSSGPVIIAAGPNGAYGHAELSDRRLREGDFVVADLFFRYEGYNSDETRTFAIGTVSAEMKKHYAIVREAQEAALDAAMVGTPCGAVNAAAVNILKRNGVDKLLNHSIGHGVGIDIHELPGIFKGNKVKLAKNDVITDEPGIYLVGKYGIRIEDTLVIDRKPTMLTKFTKDLIACG